MIFYKKWLSVGVGVLLLLSLATPTFAASGLTDDQITSILGLLKSFNADASVIANVQKSLNRSITEGSNESTTPTIQSVSFVSAAGVANLSNNPALGNFESASCTTLRGWTYDPDASSASSEFHLYRDGPLGVGMLVSSYKTEVLRPDVNDHFHIQGSHGFEIPTPAILKDGILHTLYLYTINSNGAGPNPRMSPSPLSIICTPSASGTGPIPIDVFLIAGQSNAVGYGDINKSPVPPAGVSYQYYNGHVVEGKDPTGPSAGSAWPSFAIAYFNATGHKVGFIPTAVGGSTQTMKANIAVGGPGSWDTEGILFTTSVDTLAHGLSSFRDAGFSPSFKGVLWDQGEGDAAAISFKSVTTDEYLSALKTMIGRYRAVYGDSMTFYIFQTGTRVGQSDVGYAAVRTTQLQAAVSIPNTYVVFTDAINFPQKNWLNPSDGVHYTQEGYNEMGTFGGQTVASLVQKNTSISNTPPQGNFEKVSCSNGVVGWAYDPDSQTSALRIDVYKDGPYQTGTIVGIYSANVSRLDVNNYFHISGDHGFSIPIDSSLKDGKTHQLYVYAIDSNGVGPNPLIPPSPRSITCGASARAPITHTLAQGWTGSEVTTLQTTLKNLGLFQESITGYFGQATKQAVQTFQQQNNLAAVGVVGPRTREVFQNLVHF